INSPTLIIHGKDDPMIHLRNAVKMQKLIPHSQLEIIEHMRHLIDPESLDEIAGPLLRHLRKYS
ncbi:MAG: alpha/beta hydrolase, partial [Proteobacteria bacterium]|nr:alpha/beta hydrolase [Pseudomonadota bacterium]